MEYPNNQMGLNEFSIKNVGSSREDFLNSNTLVAKISFLLLVLFIFIVLLNLGIYLLGWYFTPSSSPHLIDGTVDGKQAITINQDPNAANSITIVRSVNARNGIEFTWSVWIFIDDLQYLSGQYKHIFSKGNGDLQSNGLIFPNNAPGLYLSPYSNELVLIMNTYDVINQEINIPDIPLNKWVNVIIRCQENTLDVYINGTIIRSIILQGVPKQNYGDVYVAMNGGFSGFISNLWYYNYALGTSAIQDIARDGPNTKMKGSPSFNMKNSEYLSLRWYFPEGKI